MCLLEINPLCVIMQIRKVVNMAYSFSRLSKFERCRRSFYYGYIQHIPEDAGAAALFGSIVHDALEKEDSSQVIKDQAAYAMYLNGLKILEEIGKENIIGKEVRLAIDRKGRAIDYNSDKAFFRGIIDVLGKNFILDWKTGFKTPSPLQLGLYQLLAEANGYYPNKLQYMMLKSDTFETSYANPDLYNDSLQWLSNTAQAIEVAKKTFAENVEKWISETVEDEDKIEAAVDESFGRTIGSQCNYCSYVSICRNRILDSPVDKLNKIDLLKAELKQLNESVKNHVLETGDDIVLPDGRKYGNNLKASLACKDKKILLALLRKDGLLPEGGTLDSKDYNTFLEEHPKYASNFKTKISNSFGFKEFSISI